MAAGRSRSRSSASSQSAGTSDSEDDDRLGLGESRDPSGALPWYYHSDNSRSKDEVDKAWGIKDPAELQHWQEIHSKLQRWV